MDGEGKLSRRLASSEVTVGFGEQNDSAGSDCGSAKAGGGLDRQHAMRAYDGGGPVVEGWLKSRRRWC